jgi:hypothetical protein
MVYKTSQLWTWTLGLMETLLQQDGGFGGCVLHLEG